MPNLITVDVHQLFMYMLVGELMAAIPAGLVLKRIGFSAWWALLCFVPVAALLGLWLLAFVKWKSDGVVA